MVDHADIDHTGLTGAGTPQPLDTTDSPQFAGVNVGHASDTTLTRVSAGVVAVEGTNLVKAGAITGSGLTQATARLLGRTTASSGAVEEITVGTGLSLSAGSLSSSGSSAPIALGTSFPVSPSTNDIFLRTDLPCKLWFYNGTRWLCISGHELKISNMDSSVPISGTGTFRAAAPIVVGSDIWLVSTQAWFFVGTGSSALSASHKWVGTITDAPGGTTHATLTIDSGADGAHRQTADTAIGALLGADFELECTWTKTGTPGALYADVSLLFNHVAT